jgi:hypothetical protein
VTAVGLGKGFDEVTIVCHGRQVMTSHICLKLSSGLSHFLLNYVQIYMCGLL